MSYSESQVAVAGWYGWGQGGFLTEKTIILLILTLTSTF
jgi:hypothetical protein